jgi:uncharacterized membrane protein
MLAFPHATIASVVRALQDGPGRTLPRDEVGSPDARRLCGTFESLLDLRGSVKLAEVLDSGAAEPSLGTDETRVAAYVAAVKKRLATIDAKVHAALEAMVHGPALQPETLAAALVTARSEGALFQKDGAPTPHFVETAKDLWRPAFASLNGPCNRGRSAILDLRVEVAESLSALTPAASRLVALDRTVAHVTADGAKALEARLSPLTESAFVASLAHVVAPTLRGDASDESATLGALAAARARSGALYRVLLLAANALHLLFAGDAMRLESLATGAAQTFCV